MSVFRARSFQGFRFDPFKAPRRPRHRILRWVLGAVGVALLLGLLFVSVFVGIAMLAVGLLVRLWKQRSKPIAHGGDTIPGEYRVLPKAELPQAR
ncbi:hypothetical protein [Thermomonas sp.]|uniref:hypothetical protein n=1 Tax=Thermomonas sp. TaxID=1971895 RepID=UPI0024899C5F|nr:hypothetical protein [Thermomonas sp.]MDI1251804.1 hypothetical protein [Thermomonas sp.]